MALRSFPERNEATVDTSDSSERRSYVLRMWKERGAASAWRFSLEDVQGGQRRGFGSLAALMAFFEQEVKRHPPPHRS